MAGFSKSALLFVVGVVLSFAAGAYLGYVLGGTQAEAREMTVLAKYGVAIDLAAREGKPGAHEAALLQFLSYVEGREAVDNSAFIEEWVATEAAIAYWKLADVAERLENSLQANEYFEKSKQMCSESFLRNCSVEHLSRIAAEFSHSPLPEEPN